jgi:hypothetical protein
MDEYSNTLSQKIIQEYAGNQRLKPNMGAIAIRAGCAAITRHGEGMFGLTTKPHSGGFSGLRGKKNFSVFGCLRSSTVTFLPSRHPNASWRDHKLDRAAALNQ